MELAGKVALVTGGTKGIGAAAAIALAKRGCDVAINGRHLDDDAEAVREPGAGAGAAVCHRCGRRGLPRAGDTRSERHGGRTGCSRRAGSQRRWARSGNGDGCDARERNLRDRIPLHREGRSEDIATLIVELVTNDYITGETVSIDGGLTMRIV